ncbi:AraC family transcriptional regulator [Cohnella nanjingensis]|uniref:Helix-turn-helix transcriptional regulator n=1 Tax=Cohnella nanjingensis TaxID=1387779 RepID=A0A7X0RPS0_9BACL|nr:AraC family transcriptional regulator [Cohnella nanjingensis]MBB6671286.1 helix-turn-helix transcriptional regulator [Cohnella nanjingensis]
MDALKKIEPFEGKRFPLRMTEVKSSSHLVRPHWHDHLEFIHLLEGTAQVHIDNRTFTVDAPAILFINSCKIHSMQALHGKSCTIRGFIFDMSLLAGSLEHSESQHVYARFIQTAPILEPILPSHPIWNELVVPFELAYQEYAKQAIGCELMIKSSLYRMIIPILRGYQRETCLNKDLDKSLAHYKRLKPALDFIESCYDQKIYTDTLGSLVNMSLFHFTRFFKKVTGVTPTVFINRYRVEMAKRLLIQQDLTITQIAERTGFCNVNYFDKVFKEMNGFTPLELRKKFTEG